MAIVSRDILRRLVQEWHDRIIDERAVHESAEQLCEEYERPRLNETHPDSIAVEVLSQLEILNHQLITIDDIPAILQMLDTPLGQEVDGWKKWHTYWESIDYDLRKARLRCNDYYTT